MLSILNQFIAGLMLSGPILLVAMSLAVVLASSKVLNVAIGSTYALVAIVATRLAPTAGAPAVIAVCLVAPVVIFMLIEMVVLRAQRKRSSDPEMSSFAATLGISLILAAIAAIVSESATFTLPPGMLRLASSWHIGGLLIPQDGTLVFSVAVICTIALWFVLYRTRLGLMFRATANDTFLARTTAVRPNRIILVSWVMGGLLVGIAAILNLVQLRSVAADSGEALLLVPFAAVIAGGMGSLWGAALASVVLGVAEAMLTLVTDSGGLQDALIFGLLFVMLIVRPEGLVPGTRSTRAY